MSRLSRMVVAAMVTTFFVVLLVPETLLWAAASVRLTGGDLWQLATQSVPRPVLIVLLMILFLFISFGVIFGIIRLFTTFGTSTGERVAGWYERVTPDAPQTKAMVFMVGFVVVFIIGIAVFAPTFAASLAEDTGAGDFVDDIQQGNYEGEVERLFSGDAVRSNNESVSLRRENDTDGDGIPDDWERAGQTPDGVGLPGTSTGEMDLYVQIDTGDDIPELSDSERDQLRAIWGNMPVENPDGSTGIDLHIVEDDIDEAIQAGTPAQVDQYYSEENLGSRHCLYRQVVLGELRTQQRIGLAEAPGYTAIYDGSRYQGYDGEYPFRSAMITHALLHTITGDFEGQTHAEGGWLEFPSDGNEQLSDSVAEKLERDGFTTTPRYFESCHQQDP